MGPSTPDLARLLEEAEERLRAKAAERAREALARDLPGKAARIAMELGEEQRKTHGALHVYRGDGLKVTYDDYGRIVTVYYQRRLVLRYDPGLMEPWSVDVYVPGEWEQRLEELYREASEAELKRLIEQHGYRIRELARRYGLDAAGELRRLGVPEDIVEKVLEEKQGKP